MSEQTILEEIENFLHWYQTVYGTSVILQKDLKDVQAMLAPPKPTVEYGRKQKPTSPKLAAIKYQQTSPELQELYLKIKDCQACDLHKTRKHLVFGYGNAHADLMFVGEAPGREEDEQGIPFVGAAGKLLDKIFKAIGLNRDEVYIANVLKCRPPGNRNPLPDEVKKCEPYLKEQLKIIQPKLIVALGLYAGQSLLKKHETLSRMRGSIHHYEDIDVLVTYHPAALLRNPMWKAQAWEDFKTIRRLMAKLRTRES